MKRSMPWALVVGVVLVLVSTRGVLGADIAGGYLDTQSGIALVACAGGAMAAAKDEPLMYGQGHASKGRGDLYLVNSSGRVSVSPGGYRDPLGRIIAAPADGFDKIAYIDRAGRIVGMVGVSAQEMNLFGRESCVDLKWFFASPRLLLEGLLDAASVLSEADALEENERREIFIATVGLRTGKAAGQLVKGIMNASASAGEMDRDLSELLGIEEVATAPSSLKAVGYVAQGGDGTGGTSLVAQGGDGTGGTSVVAQGGDGGLSVQGVVMHGGVLRTSVSLNPQMKINATCRGNLFLMGSL